MMRWSVIFFSCCLLAKPASADSSDKDYEQELINYEDLTHTIRLTTLRAGNHDESGINDYYFDVTMFGLIISKEERQKEFSERKKIVVPMGVFGNVKIESLRFWQKDDEDTDIVISGNSIRQLTSEVMRNFAIDEDEVAIRVEIKMFEKNKKYIFFGKDQLITSTHYFPIPEIFPHRPNTKDLMLALTDDRGTNVRLNVLYERNDKKRASK